MQNSDLKVGYFYMPVHCDNVSALVLQNKL